MTLVEGVPEEDILKIKQEKITEKTLQSIRTHGWLLDMFRQIIRGAKDFLQDRKSTRLNSSHITRSRMPSSA